MKSNMNFSASLGLNRLNPCPPRARACTAGFQCTEASSVASTIYTPESCLGTIEGKTDTNFHKNTQSTFFYLPTTTAVYTGAK